MIILDKDARGGLWGWDVCEGDGALGALKLQVCKCVEGTWGVLGQLEAGMLQQQIVR